MADSQRLTIYLIRHGETEWNQEGRCQGVTDIPLTEKGYRQAQILAHTLADKPLSLVLTSSLQRSKETATLIATRHGLTVELRDELKEWNQGALEGLTGAELLRGYQAYFAQWQRDPANTAPPGGETLRALQQRAWPVIDQLKDRSLTGPVAIVSHSMTLSTLLCTALGLELAYIHRLKLDIASRSTLTFNSVGIFSSWVLTSLNDRHHLTGDLR